MKNIHLRIFALVSRLVTYSVRRTDRTLPRARSAQMQIWTLLMENGK